MFWDLLIEMAADIGASFMIFIVFQRII